MTSAQTRMDGVRGRHESGKGLGGKQEFLDLHLVNKCGRSTSRVLSAGNAMTSRTQMLLHGTKCQVRTTDTQTGDASAVGYTLYRNGLGVRCSEAQRSQLIHTGG